MREWYRVDCEVIEQDSAEGPIVDYKLLLGNGHRGYCDEIWVDAGIEQIERERYLAVCLTIDASHAFYCDQVGTCDLDVVNVVESEETRVRVTIEGDSCLTNYFIETV